MDRHDSPNFDNRPAGVPVDMLVLHYTGMKTAAEALDRLCDPVASVSAHYMIDGDGAVMALVDEDKRAWHAGVSFWRGHSDINAHSIGIELVNPGHEYGYRNFPDAQMTALIALAGEIVVRHPIEARNVLAHSDVAPRRKSDPGELFDWKKLSEAGIGLWPGDGGLGAANPAGIAEKLAAYGYETEDLAATLRAFQRHFRPARIDGIADAETAGRLESLLDRLP